MKENRIQIKGREAKGNSTPRMLDVVFPKKGKPFIEVKGSKGYIRLGLQEFYDQIKINT